MCQDTLPFLGVFFIFFCLAGDFVVVEAGTFVELTEFLINSTSEKKKKHKQHLETESAAGLAHISPVVAHILLMHRRIWVKGIKPAMAKV